MTNEGSDNERFLLTPQEQMHREFATRIEGILSEAKIQQPNMPIWFVLNKGEDNEEIVFLKEVTTPEHLNFDSEKIPGLTFPQYYISCNLNRLYPESDRLFTALGGVYPVFIVDPGNKVYRILNFYYFSKDGKAIKVESVQVQETQPTEEVLSFLLAKGAQKIDFQPQVGKEVVGLEPGDIEYVSHLLEEIDVSKVNKPEY